MSPPRFINEYPYGSPNFTVGCGSPVVAGVIARVNATTPYHTLTEDPVVVLQRVREAKARGEALMNTFAIKTGRRTMVLTLVSKDELVRLAGGVAVQQVLVNVGITVGAAFGVLLLSTIFVLIWAHHLDRAHQNLARQRDAMEMEERMMGLLSHELRNPAHVIGSGAEFILSALPPGHIARHDAEMMWESSETLHRLVNDVLAFTSARIGQVELKFSIVYLQPLLQRLADRHASMAMVPVRWRVAAGTPVAMICDPLRLAQILTNGLVNAAKFCERGSITIALAASGTDSPTSRTSLVFAIEDTGPGIASGESGTDFCHRTPPAQPSVRPLSAPADPYVANSQFGVTKLAQADEPSRVRCCSVLAACVSASCIPRGCGRRRPQSAAPESPGITEYTPAATSPISGLTVVIPPVGDVVVASPRSRMDSMVGTPPRRTRPSTTMPVAEEALSAAIAANSRGSGFGLPVATMLVARLGGEWCRAPNLPCTFHPPPHPSPPPPPAPPPAPGQATCGYSATRCAA
jgi:signal transduction histidine kinase